ncbi:MAG TPA: sigma-54 dependent transcriptional regulator [Verrucomicrobiae bacterium]|jgi:DNA-binding NtrC family response regulator|nr:sigma-54 dependent transcriptional regulator [Verrucomicrobiae bacterium]
MAIEKIILLEGDAVVRNSLENYLRRCRFDVASTASVPVALEYLGRDNFDVFFMDLSLRNGRGTDLLLEIQTRAQKPLVIVTTSIGSIESAVDCIRNGAFDYLIKPFSNEQIEIALRRIEDFSQLVRVNRFLSQGQTERAPQLLGCSPEIDNIRQLVRKVARTQATVLIQGESGTGKEVIAREIYQQSSRSNAPFIRVNCAAIPENLIESEFFGHEKGSFTGALNKREGRFELAHGGTILLDEISEISPGTQAKLLRVLQEREFERVGGNRTIKVDVRVIATTNRNLQESVENKEFRQDLYFRLNVVPIYVQPLRQRPEDILVLKREFMRCFCRQHGINAKGFTEEAKRALISHSWPGNVRELQNVIERAIILCGDTGMLAPEHLGLPSPERPVVITAPTVNYLPEPAISQSERRLPTLAEIEKNHILSALEYCKGNRTHAANLLDVSIRTLRNKLHEYNGTAPGQLGMSRELEVV